MSIGCCVEAIVFLIFFHTYHCATRFQDWTERWQKSESVTERPRDFRGSSLQHRTSKNFPSGRMPILYSTKLSNSGSISIGGIIQNHI